MYVLLPGPLIHQTIHVYESLTRADVPAWDWETIFGLVLLVYVVCSGTLKAVCCGLMPVSMVAILVGLGFVAHRWVSFLRYSLYLYLLGCTGVPHKNCLVGLCLPAFRLTVCPSKTVQFNYGQVQTHVIMSQLFKIWIIFVLE